MNYEMIRTARDGDVLTITPAADDRDRVAADAVVVRRHLDGSADGTADRPGGTRYGSDRRAGDRRDQARRRDDRGDQGK